MMSEQIEEQIESSETIVRFVYSPFHVKKDKLKREAFQPAKMRKDVSVQRLRYCDESTCRRIGMTQQRHSEPIKIWMGMAGFKASLIITKTQNSEPIQLIASPMDDAGNYHPKGTIVFADDSGLPAHADIFYNYVPTEGEPLPIEIKQYAQYLAEQAHFFRDPNPLAGKWEGKPIELDK